ncbi:hypothetical protein IX320_002309 [Bacteroides pyogenes]|nr:hypothetical protein [Bacteroides pyogenes]MBR8709496.1 hypothetical protein [Bacteroides pyogenes]MBR8747835.1 hypothetical protein [Bacteroides pyogenes]MBR8781773.1 hypothetical protein [Bacteroides pyogenes]
MNKVYYPPYIFAFAQILLKWILIFSPIILSQRNGIKLSQI